MKQKTETNFETSIMRFVVHRGNSDGLRLLAAISSLCCRGTFNGRNATGRVYKSQYLLRFWWFMMMIFFLKSQQTFAFTGSHHKYCQIKWCHIYLMYCYIKKNLQLNTSYDPLAVYAIVTPSIAMASFAWDGATWWESTRKQDKDWSPKSPPLKNILGDVWDKKNVMNLW